MAHVGVEAVAIGGLAVYFMHQNKLLQAQIDELKRQLQHTAIHLNNTYEDLRLELEEVKKQKTRGANRESLRRRESPVRKLERRRSQSPRHSQSPRSPVRMSTRAAARAAILNPIEEPRRSIPPPPPTPSPSEASDDLLEDDGSDVESALKRRSLST